MKIMRRKWILTGYLLAAAMGCIYVRRTNFVSFYISSGLLLPSDAIVLYTKYDHGEFESDYEYDIAFEVNREVTQSFLKEHWNDCDWKTGDLGKLLGENSWYLSHHFELTHKPAYYLRQQVSDEKSRCLIIDLEHNRIFYTELKL